MATDDFQVNLSDMTRSATHRLVRHILKSDTIASLPIHKRAEAKKQQEEDDEVDDPSEIEEETEGEKVADLHAEKGNSNDPKVADEDFSPNALAAAKKKVMPQSQAESLPADAPKGKKQNG